MLRGRFAGRARGGSGVSLPTLSLTFLTSETLDSRITFSRASNATRVDSTGKITYAPNNQLLASADLTDGGWNKAANVAATGNTAVAPDGTTTADTLTASTTGTFRYCRQAPTLTQGGSYVYSHYLKYKTSRWVWLVGETSTNAFGWFDLLNGVAGSASANITATMTSVGDGWYRCSIAFTKTSAAAAEDIGLGFSDADGGTTATAGQDVYAWGAQLESVTYQTTPSTYNATTGASLYYGPRYDYYPVNQAARGLLIEEQRTNLILRSADLSSGTWGRASVTISADSTVSPDGTTSADTITADAGNAGHYVQQAITWTAAAVHTVSWYVKYSNHAFAQIKTWDGTIDRFANFNIQTGVVGTTSGATSTISDAGGGYYKITMTSSTAMGAAAGNVQLSLVSSASAVEGGEAFNATGTEAIIAWGADGQAGAFITSHIPTAASQVTRSADVASMTGSNFSSWYNEPEGTFVVGYASTATNSGRVLCANNNTGNEEVLLIMSAGTTPAYQVYDGGALQVNQSNAAVAIGAITKTALAYKANDFAMTTNGGTLATDTSGTVASPDRLNVGRELTSDYLNGHIRSLDYYPLRRVNLDLQVLTT